MDQVLDKMEDKLIQITSFAKIIMWLSVISVIAFVLIPILFLLFLIYKFKLSNLKTNQSLSGIFNKLSVKTTKELKSIQSHGELQEQRVAGLLIAHKSMVKVLIVVEIIITITIGVIIIANISGLEMV